MLRLLICARAYPPDVAGGGEISTALIAQALARLGVTVRVVTFTDHAPVTETIEGVEVMRVRAPLPYWSLHAGDQPKWKKLGWHVAQVTRPWPDRPVRSAIQNFEPEIVHSSTIEDIGPSLWRWCGRQGFLAVHTLRSYALLHHGATLYDAHHDQPQGRDFLSYSRQRWSQSLHGVIGISQFILDRHRRERFFPRAKTCVIGNPIDEPIQQMPAPDTPTVKLGFLGRLSPEKGVIPFLQALHSMKCSTSWQLDIAGDGSQDHVQQIEQAAEGLPVRLVHWQHSRSFLSGLDLLVVPSRWEEPFGRIVVEAYSIGLPVLCLRRGGLSELVDEGVSGWSLPEWSGQAICRAIQQCRSLDRSAICQRAQPYQPDVIAAKHLAFYENLLKSRRLV